MALENDRGQVTDYGRDFDLRIATDRTIYRRWEEQKQFESIGTYPLGSTAEEKAIFLQNLRKQINERIAKTEEN